MKHPKSDSAAGSLLIRGLCKSFDEKNVLSHLTLSLSCPGSYCLMAPSGTGKTTLFSILLGLEQADCGSIEGLDGKRISAVFQENRLLEGYDALTNLRLVTGSRLCLHQLQALFLTLLPADAFKQPVSEFSGGMKRRLALLRALAVPFDILLLDEPFTGLDEENRQKAAALIRERTAGKLVIASSHLEGDAELLGAKIIRL
ncbi:MAG: ATP-binding cassette domain-containing protein [Eubacteriales bacterium]|nr:ATP-binding cassette domain-containing protein [Eubacteriales bacterium]